MTLNTKILHPIYGSSCRTQSFADKSVQPGTSRHAHAEAFMDDPVAKTWTVCEVTLTSNPSIAQKKQVSAHTSRKIKSGINFKDAAEMLSQFERGHQQSPQSYTPLYPEPPFMGFDHYKAFAEREGYVFDKDGKPHARPWPNLLPPDAIFLGDDVESAKKNLQRPSDEFDNMGPAGKTPNPHFIFDSFQRAAQRHTFDEGAAALRMLHLLDRFAEHVETAHTHMNDYCATYLDLGKGTLLTAAITELEQAGLTARQLKAYGIETREFDSFIDQAKITCNVIHAQGLYSLMHKGLGDFDENESQFKRYVTDAVEAFKLIDPSAKGMNTLQDMIVQAPEPVTPYALRAFIERFKDKRASYAKIAPAAPPKP